MRCSAPPHAFAQSSDDQALKATLETRLAYVITGDAEVDRISKAGLQGLTLFLAQRTALEAGEPIGLDPARDELAFYPLIYWPIVPSAPKPTREALEHIDAYMKQGGTVLFDTRDAVEAPPGTGGDTRGPGMQALARHPLLARHSRARAGAARPRADQDLLPAERLSRPLQLRSALGRGAAGRERGRAGEPAGARRRRRVLDHHHLERSCRRLGACARTAKRCCRSCPREPRQREFAFRAGVNIVMYTLTGNYKADQVHVPALLERLGQ